MDISEVHRNTKLLIDDVPYNVEDAEFVKPGKGRAIYRFKLRNLFDNSTVDHTFHSGEKVDEAHVDVEEDQFLYREDEDHYIFMNTETFEQRPISGVQIGEKRRFLKEGAVVQMVMFGDRPIDIAVPNFVELAVVETLASSKSATITPQDKAAKLETGATIGVPPFIKEGDILKVDTRTGIYVERVVAKK